MNQLECPALVAALERQANSGASADQIAEAVAGIWRHVEASLSPIVGLQGVAALYRRSLVLTARSHVGLSALTGADTTAFDLSALRAALAQQTGEDAALAGGEILQTFYGLVDRLIGPSLTRKLLRFMWHVV